MEQEKTQVSDEQKRQNEQELKNLIESYVEDGKVTKEERKELLLKGLQWGFEEKEVKKMIALALSHRHIEAWKKSVGRKFDVLYEKMSAKPKLLKLFNAFNLILWSIVIIIAVVLLLCKVNVCLIVAIIFNLLLAGVVYVQTEKIIWALVSLVLIVLSLYSGSLFWTLWVAGLALMISLAYIKLKKRVTNK